MEFLIREATERDSEDLLGLYASIYGEEYPLSIGTNKKVMLSALQNKKEFLWLVAAHKETNQIIGSTIFEMDWNYKIGKVMGVATNLNFQKLGIAKCLIDEGTRKILEEKEGIDSLYATCRTVSLGPQLMFLRNNFLPLGIFPNARKINTYETLVLMGKYRAGVLSRRASVPKIPSVLEPILKTTEVVTGMPCMPPEIVPLEIGGIHDPAPPLSTDDFEFIDAPRFVQERFQQVIGNDREASFYPFHRPNLLICSHNDHTEIYASFSPKDHYCALITAEPSITGLKGRLKKLIFAMKELGIYYIEVLIRLDRYEVIRYLCQHRFLPSAVYPAMMEVDGVYHDFVLLTTTMVPLDFSEIKMHQAFHPYAEQYVQQWIGLNLDVYGLRRKL
jgi:hypothetical protein